MLNKGMAVSPTQMRVANDGENCLLHSAQHVRHTHILIGCTCALHCGDYLSMTHWISNIQFHNCEHLIKYQ